MPRATSIRSRRGGRWLSGAAAAGALAFLCAPAWAAEETVRAFAVWQGEGPVVQTGEGSATFSGIFEGPVYIETEHGPMAAGAISCPATVDIELESGRQKATARCACLAADDSRIFAELTCSGVHLIGCKGDFRISGGVGRFAGIVGGGEVVVRGDFREITVAPGEPVTEAVSGILYWPDLRYSLP